MQNNVTSPDYGRFFNPHRTLHRVRVRLGEVIGRENKCNHEGTETRRTPSTKDPRKRTHEKHEKSRCGCAATNSSLLRASSRPSCLGGPGGASACEPADAEQPGGREGERRSGQAQKHAHARFRPQLARRQQRGAKKQPDAETDRGGESDDDELPPADALRQMQAGGERSAGRDEDAERLADDDRDRQSPRARLPAREAARPRSRARRRTAPPGRDISTRSRIGSAHPGPSATRRRRIRDRARRAAGRA